MTVIIVPGFLARMWPWPFSYLIKAYCKFWDLDLDPENIKFKQFREYLFNNGVKEVVIFERPTNVSTQQLASKLANFIDSIQDTKVILFGYSLGSVVSEEAIQLSQKKEKIIKLISVASPHKKKRMEIPDSVKLMNIYSDADTYIDFVNRILYLRGYKQIENAQNIQIPNRKHCDFKKSDLFENYLKLIVD